MTLLINHEFAGYFLCQLFLSVLNFVIIEVTDILLDDKDFIW
ncbi:hypothetical protein NECAME_05139, partial [Necator americanus]